MRDQGLEPRCFEDVVQVCGAVRMATEFLQHLPHRTIVRNGIEFRLHAFEVVGSVRACPENAPQIEIRLQTLLLDIVEALVVRLPDIDFGAIQWLPVRAHNAPAHEHRFPFLVQTYVGPHRQFGRVRDMEGPQDRRL